MSTCQIRKMMAETKTATEIQVSFMVSAPDATRTSDLTFLPVFFRYFANRNLAIIEAIIDTTIISTPTRIMISAITIVVMRSILSR